MSDETDKLLHHPEVLKVLRAVLRVCGFRGDALEDASQTVFVRALETTRNRPDTADAWQRLVRKIAREHGIDELRKRRSRARSNVGLTDQADEAASAANYRPRWEVADAKKALALLQMMMDEGLLPKDFDVYLDAVQAGVPQKQIALEAGMPEDRYIKQQWRARKAFMARLSSVGLGGLMVVGMLLLVFGYLDPNHVAHHGTETTLPDAGLPGAGGVREPLPPQVMVDTHKEEVAALREKIAGAAKARDWKTCVTLYMQLDAIVPEDPKDTVKRDCVNGLTEDLVGKARRDAGTPRRAP